ncbi:MAG: histidine--tRNA ligase [Candidatus Pacebacteria bacterium]|nr:histidine--tRNA ligase [Candidatus Paceibacterota bacterium]
MKKLKFQSQAGMNDILPEDQKYFKKVYEVVSEIADFYGFSKIETPILENADLFTTATGTATDIVKKQMYSFRTKSGDFLTLRPEGTPGIIRAYIEHGMQNLPHPVKLWYFGPFFRYERPQSGRYRQFHQFGFEVIGEKGAVVDAQIIQIFYNILKELKLKSLIIEINSIGDSQCRPYYKKLLSNYFRNRESSLCVECRRRLKENVLRILDCKEEKCQPVKADAPQILDHLCEECRLHFKEVLEFLDEVEIPYRLNPYLVRGLDYYTKTIFEIFSISEKQDQDSKEKELALGGGGRYDKLVKILGGKDMPASGGAVGIERVVSLLKNQDVRFKEENKVSVFIAQLGNLAKRKSLKLMDGFRKMNIKVAESFGKDSLKAQLNRADRIGAKYSLIIGQQESLDNTVIIRDMKTGKQNIVKFEKVLEEIKRLLKNK